MRLTLGFILFATLGLAHGAGEDENKPAASQHGQKFTAIVTTGQPAAAPKPAEKPAEAEPAAAPAKDEKVNVVADAEAKAAAPKENEVPAKDAQVEKKKAKTRLVSYETKVDRKTRGPKTYVLVREVEEVEDDDDEEEDEEYTDLYGYYYHELEEAAKHLPKGEHKPVGKKVDEQGKTPEEEDEDETISYKEVTYTDKMGIFAGLPYFFHVLKANPITVGLAFVVTFILPMVFVHILCHTVLGKNFKWLWLGFLLGACAFSGALGLLYFLVKTGRWGNPPIEGVETVYEFKIKPNKFALNKPLEGSLRSN
ncbi:hypothetical protein BgAZ_305110 [Babesia gibsoni]|uniref:Uncharacterized protein n=1 Tax=Babesia gibsoni TaxID=33632 RepID=A0AAD8LK84_BABGI|nr:hypothetical protein BgAZ_305110 [Babesia gibsoni]